MTELIYCIGTQRVHKLEVKNAGENYSVCPECSHNRKKSKDKCFSYNKEQGVGHCNHCDERFVKYEPHEKKEFTLPKWENFTELSDKAAGYFQNDRMIGQNTLRKMQISSKKVFMPQISKETECICFPFFRRGTLVNVKYRDARKNFKLESGAELIWFNYDAILNHKEVIITEGEIDALSFIDDGYENVISVPNGASTGSMTYLDNSINDLDKVDLFYIAVDNDAKGLELRDELIRRLGSERCKVCTFKQFKDANEYRKQYGHESLHEVISSAKGVPVSGIYTADDFLEDALHLHEHGLQPGATVGVYELDQLITWETKRLAIITGTPSSGKSELVDFINVKLNLRHGWKVGYWTPENFPLQYHYSKLFEKLYGSKFNTSGKDDFWNLHNYIKQNFFWVSPDEDLTIDNLLVKFKYLVKTRGIKVVCIDPFNKIEYKHEPGESKLDFTSKLLDKLIQFAKVNDVLVQLIAHPRKLEKDRNGLYPMPSMYDISGSSDFWNKCDYGLSVKREQNRETSLFENWGVLGILKVKFKHLGQQGEWNWKYNYHNGRYEHEHNTVEQYDKSNWIGKTEEPEEDPF